MIEAIHNATFIHYVAIALLLAYFYVVICGKKALRPWLRKGFVLAMVGSAVWLFLLWLHRNEVRRSLQELLVIASYTKEIDKKLANGAIPSDIVRDLKKQKAEIEEKCQESSLCDEVLGRSEAIDTLMAQLNIKIDQEIFRVENMSLRSSESYKPTFCEKTQDELYLINPVFTSESYMNVGVVIDEEASFKKENALLVRVIRTDNDSLLYQQTYIPKSGANSFVLPNFFNDDMVQLQIGYINKKERNIYHYISCVPYGRK